MSQDRLTGKNADRIIIDDPWAEADADMLKAESIARLAGISAPEVPLGTVTGFDVSSGTDQTATATIRVGKGYSFTVEDIELHDVPPSAFAQMQDYARRQQEELVKAMMGVTDPPWQWEARGDPRPRPEHWNCRSTMNPRWGDGAPLSEDERDLINGRFRGNDLITDPADQRGFSARPVRGRVVA